MLGASTLTCKKASLGRLKGSLMGAVFSVIYLIPFGVGLWVFFFDCDCLIGADSGRIAFGCLVCGRYLCR